MTVPGCDYSTSRPDLGLLRGRGLRFIGRYSCPDNPLTHGKILFPAEAREILAAGFAQVLVFEWYESRIAEGYGAGRADALTAYDQAAACGLDTIPVYFSADYDAPPGDQDNIHRYLDGAASRLGDDRARNLYGGFWPLSRARAAGVIKRLWGTPGWSGTNWDTCGWKPDIMQGGQISVGGQQIDLDNANTADFGQWPRPAPLPAVTKLEAEPMLAELVAGAEGTDFAVWPQARQAGLGASPYGSATLVLAGQTGVTVTAWVHHKDGHTEKASYALATGKPALVAPGDLGDVATVHVQRDDTRTDLTASATLSRW